MVYYSYLILLQLLGFVFSQTTEDATTRIKLTDDQPSVIWSPTATDLVVFQADLGYKLALNVTSCNISSQNGDYVKIYADNNDPDNTLMFLYSLPTQSSCVFNINNVTVEVQYSKKSLNNSFTAIITRIGEPVSTVTTDVPTTPQIIPTADLNDSTTLSVYIYGLKINLLTDQTVLDTLRNAIAGMAAQYCSDNNCPINGTITSKNVIFEDSQQCAMTWEDYENCVMITFAVPIPLLNDVDDVKWSGYQFKQRHLALMWERLADSYLTPYGFSVYAAPDVDNIVTWRVVLFSFIVFFVFVLLLVISYILVRHSKQRKRRFSDVSSIIKTPRNSDLSLHQHYLQETPPLFENAYQMFNPAKEPVTYTEPTYSGYEEYEDFPEKVQEETYMDEPKLKITDVEINEEESGA